VRRARTIIRQAVVKTAQPPTSKKPKGQPKTKIHTSQPTPASLSTLASQPTPSSQSTLTSQPTPSSQSTLTSQPTPTPQPTIAPQPTPPSQPTPLSQSTTGVATLKERNFKVKVKLSRPTPAPTS